jgi:hypothetical protein
MPSIFSQQPASQAPALKPSVFIPRASDPKPILPPLSSGTGSKNVSIFNRPMQSRSQSPASINNGISQNAKVVTQNQVHSDGSSTVRTFDSLGRLLSIEARSRSGAVHQRDVFDPITGQSQREDLPSGRRQVCEAGNCRTDLPGGVIRRQTRVGGERVDHETRNGREWEYRNRRERFGRQDTDIYHPTNSSGNNDDFWFWMWWRQSQNTGGSPYSYPPVGAPTSSSTNGSSSSTTQSVSTKAAGFNIDWRSEYPHLPKGLETNRSYVDGFSYISDFIIFDTIAEYSRPNKIRKWYTRFTCLFASCNAADYASKDYAIATEIRLVMKQQLAATIDHIRNPRPLSLSEFLDEKTGELKVDSKSSVKVPRYLVVDEAIESAADFSESCSLRAGDVISLIRLDVATDRPVVKVIRAASASCQAGAEISIAKSSDLQDMLNLEIQRTERGMNRVLELVIKGKISLQDMLQKQ